MQYSIDKKQGGFTLIEMLLVMVIISIIIYAMVGYVQSRAEQTRIDRTTLQMQQILNAGLAYYIDNGQWPKNNAMTDLQGVYLPPTTVPFVNAWAQPFSIYAYPVQSPPPSNPTGFFVFTKITSATTSGSANAAATAIAGLLPSSYATGAAPPGGSKPPPAGTPCGTSNTCYVVASVNIPGQNINNARAVNFAGLYHQGACVPVPECPVDVTNTQMQAQIMVVPVSVSGLNGVSGGTGQEVFPISSFTAYARGGTDQNPAACDNSTVNPIKPSCTTNVVGKPANKYWRVCLQVVTEKGDVQKVAPINTNWGKQVTLMAITRCSVNNEPAGSNFSVYSN